MASERLSDGGFASGFLRTHFYLIFETILVTYQRFTVKDVEGAIIEQFGTGNWTPLTRKQALAARDFSKAGETFVDYTGRVNEILYSILTPLGYQACVSVQRLKHIDKHPRVSWHKSEIPHILNNPDLVTPNPDQWDTHIFYKFLDMRRLLTIAMHNKDDVRFVTTMYDTFHVKGLKQNLLIKSDFLYLRGGFKWKKWK